jgi:hypothetical protein
MKLTAKRRPKKMALAILSVLLLSSLIVSSFTVTTCKAADYTKVGVKIGDWAHYSVDTNATSSHVDFANLTVTNIDRSNVTIRLVAYNSTYQATGDYTGNLTSGDLWGWLVSANLTQGDPLWIGSPYVINDTSTLIVSGKARVCNHLNYTESGLLFFTDNRDIYWDKATGILVRSNDISSIGSGHVQVGYTLISTSLWSPPDYTEVGVNVGDWAYYSGTTNATGAPAAFDINFTITNIDRTNVTATITMYFATNRTFGFSQTTWINVSDGNWGPQGASIPVPWFLVIPNLTEGDPIFINAPYIINDTGFMNAGGRARTYAHINVTAGGSIQDLRIDQVTGIGMQVRALTWDGFTHTRIGWNLISTSLWSPNYTKVGVKVGDWANYSVKTNQTGMETATGTNITILAVDRLNVTYRITPYNSSGPILLQTNWGNISDGMGTVGQPPLYWWLIEPDLAKYDPLCARSSLWVNETVTMTINGVPRECNHLRRDYAYLGETIPGSVDFYWDKATGITVKADIILHAFGTTWHIQWNMTTTSLWSLAPTIDQPSVVTYTFGTTGHSITWHPSSQIPDHYTISINGGSPTSYAWNGGSITQSVDGLLPGTYAYNCTVYDTQGRTASSTVTVDVTLPLAPTIDQPSSISYTVLQTGNTITWHPTSTIPNFYTISVNGGAPTSHSWSGGAITQNVDGLLVGTYTYNCTVYDTLGRRASSIVTVTVGAAQLIPTELLIGGIAGIAAVAIVVAAVVIRKRRGRWMYES